MQVKNEIFDILRTNYTLRKVISDKLDIRIVNVERWAQRKSVPSWYKDTVIETISTELKISKDKIQC